MMTGYYQETVEEIERLLKDKKAEEASALLERELAMPYIPPDVEEQLHRLKSDCTFLLGEKRGSRQASEDELLDCLHGTPEQQMQAADALYGMNLRRLVKELQAYLADDPYEDAAALLIEGIAEQEVGDEFVYNHNGIEYTFWGDAVTPVNESEGFRRALAFLREWLGAKHPDMYALARTLLIHKAFVLLPLSYESEEGEALASEVVKEISGMMDDGEIYEEIVRKKDAGKIDGSERT